MVNFPGRTYGESHLMAFLTSIFAKGFHIKSGNAARYAVHGRRLAS